MFSFVALSFNRRDSPIRVMIVIESHALFQEEKVSQIGANIVCRQSPPLIPAIDLSAHPFKPQDREGSFTKKNVVKKNILLSSYWVIFSFDFNASDMSSASLPININSLV